MKRFVHILSILSALLLCASCFQEEMDHSGSLPEGTPVTLRIPFGAEDVPGLDVGTKAEASRVDESRVHDLYVLIFDNSGNKFYGRFFTYEHMTSDLSTLGGNANEGWYVNNVTASSESSEKTQGVVKISTLAKEGCTLVVIANLENAVTSLDGENPIDRLTEIKTLDELKGVQVQLEQNVVNRDDLFLMLDYKENLSTSDMVWYTDSTPNYDTPNYNSTYKVSLNRIDAKVKFRIKVNTTNISSIEPRYWQVFNVPSSCFLYPNTDDPDESDGRFYFDTDEVYFEGEETADGSTWQVFTFYMLENRQEGKQTAADYHDREKQKKNSTGQNSGKIYNNGEWLFAPDNGTYVKFDVVLTLTSDGIDGILDPNDTDNEDYTGYALTTDAVFTVHLGNFGNSSSNEWNYNDYNTERNHSYSYDITINNSWSIYVEVTDENRNTEPQPGQEGSLLFATDEIVHCDAHYEYHSVTFRHNPMLNKEKISWNVKTPFCEGGGKWNTSSNSWEVSDGVIDYKWVKFALNEVNNNEYESIRQGYPGDEKYIPGWTPSTALVDDQLLDIHQLIMYIFDQTEKETALAGSSDFKGSDKVIRMTAFIDEFYYETDPRTGKVNPDLWREFVNAKPREMHILSDAYVSADGMSDIVNSTHSIIQKSIQTIYNISSPFLSSIWGTEHIDEMKYTGSDNESVKVGWPWDNRSSPTLSGKNNAYFKDIDNGRYNTAGIWGLNPTPNQLPLWSTFLQHNVDNTVPELRESPTNYRYMAYSCMTRNRDNNGNERIDPEEVRWYLAAINQLTGLWVGNEALSPSARIYQPIDASSTDSKLWRSHVVSSSCIYGVNNPRTLIAEEGTSIYDDMASSHGRWEEAFPNKDKTDATWNKVQSVRCVRNAGTYIDPDTGKITDISYAPLDTDVDTYYEAPAGVNPTTGRIRPNEDGSYTLRFDNLNTKSIREYVAEDLPFHDEYSAHNRVYLELDTQTPDNVSNNGTFNVSTDGTLTNGSIHSMHYINEDVTAKGYNSYCPPGYRLPNMTELSLMASLLPDSFWGSSSCEIPSRTYFSKGEYNKGVEYSTEKVKTGWTYNKTNMRLVNTGKASQTVRCVRDYNLTGDISGKLSLSKERVPVNEDLEVYFNFTSSASAFTDVALALCYIDSNGNEKELSIPVEDISLYGMVLRGSMTYRIPSDFPVRGSVSFKATLRNTQGQLESFSTPATILSNIEPSIRLLPCDYDANRLEPQFPVLLNAICEDSGAIDNWKLKVVTPDGVSSTIPLTPGTTSSWSMVYNYNYSLFSNLQTGTYTFQLIVEDSAGIIIRTDEVSMDVLLKDYQPDGAAWSVAVSGGIGANEFVEAKMDVSSYTSNMENIISIGTKIDGELRYTYAFNLYYPKDNNKMILEPVAGNWSIRAIGALLTLDGTSSTSGADLLILRMDQSGVFWNGHDFAGFWDYNDSQETRYYALLKDIYSSSPILIGSMEGSTRSHADYKFIRVVHNGPRSNMTIVNGDYEYDPINGGDL